MKLHKKFQTVLVYARISTKRFFRDRLAIFFGIAFPLIFLFVFGGIFGKSSSVSFNVAVINSSKSPIAVQFQQAVKDNKVFKVSDKYNTVDSAKDALNNGEIDAVIQLPANFGEQSKGQLNPTGEVIIGYTQNGEQAASTLATIIDSQLKQLNGKFVSTALPFTVKTQQINIQGLSRFDYMFAGLLGFAIIGIGIFGPINVFPELKKQGILRRLSTTPIRVWQYFMSTAISQVVVGLLTIAIMFITAILIFNLHVIGNYLLLLLFSILSIVCILGIGLALGGWAKNERQVAPLANIIVFPMLFLSGTFFPRFAMPEWLQSVSAFLPLTPVIEGIRLIANEGKSLLEIMPQVGMVSAWTVVIYFVAFKLFRWE